MVRGEFRLKELDRAGSSPCRGDVDTHPGSGLTPWRSPNRESRGVGGARAWGVLPSPALHGVVGTGSAAWPSGPRLDTILPVGHGPASPPRRER